ncbi:Gaa1-like protein [Sporodiniella umbellata]|nr:Gaa1-like protein [Sporodiniella umbellata]
MLLAKIKERMMSRGGGNVVDPQKQIRIFRFLQRFAPALSFVLFLVGTAWILILPSELYSKGTYISENALLPGQANIEYGYNDIRAAEDYVHKLVEIQEKESEIRAQSIHEEFRRSGFISAVQHFTLDNNTKGTNVFAINKAPRSDGKEALILSAPWMSRTGEYNTNGIAVLMSLAKLFKRNVYWAKDIILLITDQEKLGTQAWLDAYHGIDEDGFSAITMPRSGTIQGAINLDFPGTQYYEALGIFFEGVNGQLPNLDLINTVVAVAERTNPPMSITLHDTVKHPFSNSEYSGYFRSLFHMLNSMKYLVFGHPSSDAGLYLKYRIDAITIHGISGTTNLNNLYGHGRIGRLVESSFRSLNNLLEHFHQSFFFYMLSSPYHYVSISQYMPPVILFACAFIIQSLVLYYLGSQPIVDFDHKMTSKKRHHLFAFIVLVITHAAGMAIFGIMQPSFSSSYLGQFTREQAIHIQYGTSLFLFWATVFLLVAWVIKSNSPEHDGTMLKLFCLAESALAVATVSLLNFALGVATALLILMPYTLIQPSTRIFWKCIQTLVLAVLSPPGLLTLFSIWTEAPLSEILSTLLFDYQHFHSWFLTFVCSVYWPIHMAMIVSVFTQSLS